MDKICTKCKENKSLDNFYKDISKKDNKESQCKNCRETYKKVYRINNKQKVSKHRKNYRIEHKQEISESDKKYYTNNRQKILENQKKYNIKNKKRISKYQQKYRKTENGKLAKIKDYHNRKINIENALKDFTTKESNIILFLQNYQCANPNCEYGRFFDILKPTLDHIKPVSKGGDLIKENVQYLCQSCNSKKRVQIIDYRTEIHKKIIATI